MGYSITDEIYNRSMGVVPDRVPSPEPPVGTKDWSDNQQREYDAAGEPALPAPQINPPKGEKKKRVTMSDLLADLRKAPAVSEEEQKRHRRNQAISGVGDAISAISNLVFASQGAPSMYSAKNSATTTERARWEKHLADRNAQREAYINQQIKAKSYDDEMDMRQEQLDMQRKNINREFERWKWEQEMHPYRLKAAKAAADKAEHDADAAKIKAAYAGMLQEAEIKRKNATAHKSSRADRRKYTLDVGGQKHEYDTKEEYEAAVMRYAKQYKIPTQEDNTSTSTTDNGILQPVTTTRTEKKNRKISSVAAEVTTKSNSKIPHMKIEWAKP